MHDLSQVFKNYWYMYSSVCIVASPNYQNESWNPMATALYIHQRTFLSLLDLWRDGDAVIAGSLAAFSVTLATLDTLALFFTYSKNNNNKTCIIVSLMMMCLCKMLVTINFLVPAKYIQMKIAIWFPLNNHLMCWSKFDRVLQQTQLTQVSKKCLITLHIKYDE